MVYNTGFKTVRNKDYKVTTTKGNVFVRAKTSADARVRARIQNPNLKISDILGAKVIGN